MLQQLPQTKFFRPESYTAKEAVKSINKYISDNCCTEISVDISDLNMTDACYVSTLCSTEHYIKHPSGRINWLVSSPEAAELAGRLQLGNSSYEINRYF